MDHETTNYVRRLEQVLEAKKGENSALYEALHQLDPTEAKKHHRLPDWPSRYQVLDNLVTTTNELIQNYLDDGRIDTDLLNQLADAQETHHEYWDQLQAERAKRTAITQKARATRRANETDLATSS